jgi:hypothetical protein
MLALVEQHKGSTALIAAAFLESLLHVYGPMRPRDVKSFSVENGLRFSESDWHAAKRKLGVESVRSGRDWYWLLPTDEGFDADLAAWLDSPEGRFAEYLVQRERSRPAQLALDVEEAA